MLPRAEGLDEVGEGLPGTVVADGELDAISVLAGVLTLVLPANGGRGPQSLMAERSMVAKPKGVPPPGERPTMASRPLLVR